MQQILQPLPEQLLPVFIVRRPFQRIIDLALQFSWKTVSGVFVQKNDHYVLQLTLRTTALINRHLHLVPTEMCEKRAQ